MMAVSQSLLTACRTKGGHGRKDTQKEAGRVPTLSDDYAEDRTLPKRHEMLLLREDCSAAFPGEASQHRA